jgi:predicted patatin/cPLA2 family phospholipase
MKLKNTSLILEGGGLRGIYTGGVLEFLMKKNIYFPYVIGVSMGACNAANYVSKQIERNRVVSISFVNDPRYLSYRRLLTHGELFGMDFIFKTIPEEIVPFDYTTFAANPQKCITTVTDCVSGEAVYFEKSQVGKDYFSLLQASSSLPMISKPVEYNGRIYMDGGMADSIPIEKSIADGNKKHLVILTQPAEYRKKPQIGVSLVRKKYPRFTGLARALEERHLRYNESLDLVEKLRKEKKAFVIRPRMKIRAARVERNKTKLYAAYDMGYRDAEDAFSELQSFLS